MQIVIIILSVSVFFGGLKPTQGEGNDDPVRLTVEASINQEHLADLFTFTMSSVSDQPLLHYTLENRSDQPQQVKLITTVSSDNHGKLVTASQNGSTPITIPPGETIRFTNLDIINKTVPGADGNIHFNFTLNSTARNIYSRLLQGAVPGNDRFVVETSILGSESGFTTTSDFEEHKLEFTTAIPQEALQVGVEDTTDLGIDRQSVMLNGSSPRFTWTGRKNVSYRLIVARDSRDNDAAELIENRFQQPFSETSTRDLQNDIMLDVMVEGNQYEVPQALAGHIEPGYQYEWQVRGMLPTTNGYVEIISDVRSFTTGISVEEELYQLLILFFGENRVSQMIDEGMELHRLEIEGVIYSAKEAVEYLNEIKEKIEQNRAAVGS